MNKQVRIKIADIQTQSEFYKCDLSDKELLTVVGGQHDYIEITQRREQAESLRRFLERIERDRTF